MMKNRKKQRGFLKTTWIVIPLLFCATGLFAWNWAAQRSWPVEWVQVEGTFRHVSAEEIRAQVVPMVRTGFFGIDAPTVRSTIEDMPWIRRADIRRRWPDALVVTVEEQEPVARWHGGGLMNDNGELFGTGSAGGFEALPMLAGPAGTEKEVFEVWRACSEVLLPVGLLIRSLSLDERRAWSLELDDGTEVALGRKATDTRVRRLARVYARLMDTEPPPVAVDLRYSNGLAVRREIAPALAPGETPIEQGETATEEELAADAPPAKDNSA